MKSELNIEIEQAQANVPVTVLHLRGWLDAQGEEQLLGTARTVHDGEARYLLLDMGELDTLTSAGIRAIQKAYRMYTPGEDHMKVSHLKLCNAPPQIYIPHSVTNCAFSEGGKRNL